MSKTSPTTPKYNTQEAVSQELAAKQRSGMTSAGGNIKWTDQGYTIEDAPTTTAMRENLSTGLSGLSMDPTQAQNTYYQSQMRMLQPQMEEQRKKSLVNLQNQGIPVGSQAYNKAVEQVDKSQSEQQQNLLDKAMFSGTQYTGSQLSNLGQLSSMIDQSNPINKYLGITSENMYDKQYGADVQRAQEKAAKKQAQQDQWSQIAGAGLGLFSDKRLKENLIPVGELYNGLIVYIGNYNDKAIELDPTLNKNPQLFLIAQEVKEVNPLAVSEENGYLKVDYKEAVKNGK